LFRHDSDDKYDQVQHAARDKRCADSGNGDESEMVLRTDFGDDWQGVVSTRQVGHVYNDVGVFLRRLDGVNDLRKRRLLVTQIRLDPNGGLPRHRQGRSAVGGEFVG
jgi:hypothetical protein